MKYETDILWFDGEWEDSWDHQKGMDLYQYARGLKNDILINNRVDKGREGMHGMTRSTVFAGDFGTPEQRVGAFYPADPWESCITLCRQWSWKPNDQLKSLRECIHTLVQTAGGGGNLLLNIGPMSDGRIEQRQIDRLLGIGRWLKENGESIYGTRGGPYKPNRWLASTCKDRRIFIHLLGWPLGQLSLASPPDRTVRSVKFLNGGELSYTQTNSLIDIRLPENPVDQHVTVIVLELDKNTESIEPLEVMPIALKGLHGAQLKLKDPYSQKYAADGIESLLDENRGSRAYTDGNWLGFEQVDFEVDIDFGVEKPVKAAGLGFLQSQDSWIFLPETVEIFVSADGETYKPAGRLEMQPVKSNRAIETEDVLVKIKPLKTRYLRIRAENTGLCPDWHKGAGGKAWLFVDEIIVD
jgi:alpha-L-fucosidase